MGEIFCCLDDTVKTRCITLIVERGITLVVQGEITPIVKREITLVAQEEITLIVEREITLVAQGEITLIVGIEISKVGYDLLPALAIVSGYHYH